MHWCTHYLENLENELMRASRRATQDGYPEMTDLSLSKSRLVGATEHGQVTGAIRPSHFGP